MKPLDVGIDAAAIMRVSGSGRVRAVFDRALYLDVRGRLLVLTTPALPRGPLHIRVPRLPSVSPGDAVSVDDETLRVADDAFTFDAPVWSPELPQPAPLAAARNLARAWLSPVVPPLGVAGTQPAVLPSGTLVALRGGDLCELGARLGGRGPGLTPAGDDMLAGALLVAYGMWSQLPAPGDLLRGVATNDIALAFLRCAARGRCIEPAHELLAALARADQPATNSTLVVLSSFGSSSGTALAFGIRAALLELPAVGPYPVAPNQLVWSMDESDIKRGYG